jgi:hypothetical protein
MEVPPVCLNDGRSRIVLRHTIQYRLNRENMTRLFVCPYLATAVELTEEREQHITATHPGTLPDYLTQLAETLADPDQIRHSDRDETALLFSKGFDTIRTGRYFIVVTVINPDQARYWVITAYTARKLAGGEVIWQKP